MKTKIVAKFGGTSLGDAVKMLKCAEIAHHYEANVVVVSATSKTTDQLLALSEVAVRGDGFHCQAEIERICGRHRNMSRQLEIEVGEAFDKLEGELVDLVRGVCLLKECSPRALAKISSFGERISSLLFTHCLNRVYGKKCVKLVDARMAIKTNSDYLKATVDFENTARRCRSIFVDSPPFVVQGFIGSDGEDKTTLLGRGGSDYTASIIAEAIGASVLQIWTDVGGIKSADPKICPNARDIHEITFKEASELATFGAKILHPATLIPARRSGIKTFVGNSFDPSSPGTWIVKEGKTPPPLVRAVTKRDDQCLLTVSTPKMLHAHGFLYHIFKVFNDHSISVDAVTTSEISVALTINKHDLTDALLKDLKTFTKTTIEKELSLISIIGNNIHTRATFAASVFHCLDDIEVRMICQGASGHNFCFLVKSHWATQAIERINEKILEGGT